MCLLIAIIYGHAGGFLKHSLKIRYTKEFSHHGFDTLMITSCANRFIEHFLILIKISVYVTTLLTRDAKGFMGKAKRMGTKGSSV